MITYKIAGLVLAVVLTGCSRSKTISSPSGDVKVEESGKPGDSTVTITGKDGAKVMIASEGGKLPDDYPKDAPVMSGARIVMASSTSTADSNGMNVVLESPDGFEKTVAFYKKALPDNGWKSESNVSAEKMTMFVATKDKRHLVVQITEADGKCSVTEILSNK